jgi:hypothetical protein
MIMMTLALWCYSWSIAFPLGFATDLGMDMTSVDSIYDGKT